MTGELERYLEDVREGLELDPTAESEIIFELETHAEDRLREMQDAGLSEEEATRECVGLLGSARTVARQIYEAHSQGTWRQALLAAVPHLVFAVLFALRWWDVDWLLVMIALTAVTAVYGWWHGKPTWLFPWLGYMLLPVVITGLLLLYLPTGWAWATILLYVPLILWLLCYIAIKAINRDWLYSALMLLPLPSLIGWSLAARPGDRFSGFNIRSLNDFAPWIAISFLLLAIAVTAFVRLRQRRWKVVALGTAGMATVVMIGLAGGSLSFPVFLVLLFLTLAFMSAPALLARRFKRRHHPALT